MLKGRIQQSVADGDRNLLFEAVMPSLETYLRDTTIDELLGMFSAEPELIDQMVSEVMAARETHLLTLGG